MINVDLLLKREGNICFRTIKLRKEILEEQPIIQLKLQCSLELETTDQDCSKRTLISSKRASPLTPFHTYPGGGKGKHRDILEIKTQIPNNVVSFLNAENKVLRENIKEKTECFCLVTSYLGVFWSLSGEILIDT